MPWRERDWPARSLPQTKSVKKDAVICVKSKWAHRETGTLSTRNHIWPSISSTNSCRMAVALYVWENTHTETVRTLSACVRTTCVMTLKDDFHTPGDQANKALVPGNQTLICWSGCPWQRNDFLSMCFPEQSHLVNCRGQQDGLMDSAFQNVPCVLQLYSLVLSGRPDRKAADLRINPLDVLEDPWSPEMIYYDGCYDRC